MDRFKELSKRFNGDKPQCYKTANTVVDKFNKNILYKLTNKNVTLVKRDMPHLYNLMPSITVIELNIVACSVKSCPIIKSASDNPDSCDKNSLLAKYNIANRFWIPRIFNHSFNILITEETVIISQSWFRFMNYKKIEELSHLEFIKWLDRLRSSIKTFHKKPKQLFKIFHDNKMETTESGYINFVKDVTKINTEYIIKFREL